MGAPLLQENGRIVQISSSAGPSYVAKCRQDVQSKLVTDVTWAEVEKTIMQPYLNVMEDASLTAEGKKASLESLGPYLVYGGLTHYGLGYRGLGYGLGHYYYGKREAEAAPKAEADPYLLYGGLRTYGYGLGYYGL